MLAITSPEVPKYNCIAFAAGDTKRWWWPSGQGYWPKGIVRVETLPAFERAFETLGYARCADGTLENGCEKIVFFHKNSKPTHAAKQRKDGMWVSKMGRFFDISHDLPGMQGAEYGEIAFYMKRRISNAY